MSASPTKGEPNPPGTRNSQTFDHLRHNCMSFDNRDDFLTAAQAYNDDWNLPPLPAAEVLATAASVWRYREGGTLMVEASYVTVSRSEVGALFDVPNGHLGLVLLVYLRSKHGALNQPIAIASDSIAGTRDIPKMFSPQTVRKARRALEAVEILRCVKPHRPDRYGNHEPAQYTLKAAQE